MELRLELFVADLEKSADFYRRVLGFQVREQSTEGYTMLTNGRAIISLNARSSLPSDHPVQLRPGERGGLGVEVVLSIADIDAAHSAAKASGWPLSDELASRPWGLVDFRLVDPDGYYIRVTSHRSTEDFP